MKRLLLILLPVLMGAGTGSCEITYDTLDLARQHFPKPAVCSWFDDSHNNHEIICISEGRRFSCLVNKSNHVECALTTASPPAPKEAE